MQTPCSQIARYITSNHSVRHDLSMLQSCFGSSADQAPTPKLWAETAAPFFSESECFAQRQVFECLDEHATNYCNAKIILVNYFAVQLPTINGVNSCSCMGPVVTKLLRFFTRYSGVCRLYSAILHSITINLKTIILISIKSIVHFYAIRSCRRKLTWAIPDLRHRF